MNDVYAIDHSRRDGRAKLCGDGICPTLEAAAGTGGGNLPLILKDNEQNTVFSIEGNGQRPSHLGDGYHADNAMYTLNTTEVHGVSYSINHQGGDTEQIMREQCGTLTAATNSSGNNKLSVAYGINSNDCKENTNAVAFDMTHACDVIRECGEVAPTLQNRMGTGGNQVPLTIETRAFTQNQREEVRDLGNKSGSLSADAGIHQQTYVAQHVFDVTGAYSNSMKSPTPDSCFRERDVSKTLDGFVETPTCNQGGQVVVKAFHNRPFNVGLMDDVCPTLNSAECSKMPGQTIVESLPVHNEKTYQDVTGPLMANSHPGSYCGQDAYNDMLITEERNSAKAISITHDIRSAKFTTDGITDPLTSTDYKEPTAAYESERPGCRYIVRRLTPTECARLQGFPDWWCDGVPGSDSAQYKMWGNGMTLPVVWRVLAGIKKAWIDDLLES